MKVRRSQKRHSVEVKINSAARMLVGSSSLAALLSLLEPTMVSSLQCHTT